MSSRAESKVLATRADMALSRAKQYLRQRGFTSEELFGDGTVKELARMLADFAIREVTRERQIAGCRAAANKRKAALVKS